MNCQQFQETLPFIIESGGTGEDESHLKTCTDCASLVQDLRYIAEQAKLLLPMHDPNPRVWQGIKNSLQREGLLEGRMSPQGHSSKYSTPQQAKTWTPLGSVLALLAVIAFAAALFNYNSKQLPPMPLSAQNSSAEPAQLNSDDNRLISQLSEQSPDARSAYESSLRDVNAYISDAKKAAESDPEDATAQELLQDAYQQKEMLYQMATARSLP
ncbi:MAG TPA: hypothetical protein VHA06_20525 [Candidatus Angelobacter sp.]|jgi:hypothetical protein|nr:hypothetical protein [Candidatus Angelobacter sp.]